MKIQVITYTRTMNYGGVLQAYGLYSHLESCGYDVSFIDYIPERCNVEDKDVFSECITRQSRFWGRNSLTKYAWQKLEYPRLLEAFRPFQEFLGTRCSFTRRYTSCDDLMANPPQGDVFITGSDQVWNSGFTSDGKIDAPFYLPFAQNKKISYASSFGTASLSQENAGEVAKLLSGYDAISVREQSGLDILRSLGLRGVTACDPTMLCDPRVWEGLSPSGPCADHVFLYQVQFNRETFEVAREIARLKGKRLVVVSMSRRSPRRVREGTFACPTVEEWLGLIRHADSVITDSFHASVFSILFNKPFLVDMASRKAMSTRISDLLDGAGFVDRELVGKDAAEVLRRLDSPIDWAAVDHSVEKRRVESREWLSNALEC